MQFTKLPLAGVPKTGATNIMPEGRVVLKLGMPLPFVLNTALFTDEIDAILLDGSSASMVDAVSPDNVTVCAVESVPGSTIVELNDRTGVLVPVATLIWLVVPVTEVTVPVVVLKVPLVGNVTLVFPVNVPVNVEAPENVTLPPIVIVLDPLLMPVPPDWGAIIPVFTIVIGPMAQLSDESPPVLIMQEILQLEKGGIMVNDEVLLNSTVKAVETKFIKYHSCPTAHVELRGILTV